MHELKTWPEIDEWLSTRQRVGFIGGNETVELQNDVWLIELYQKENGAYSIMISLDDESMFVCDFE